MEADRESMGFIPETTKQSHTQLIRFTVERLAFTGQKHLFPLLGQGTDLKLLLQVCLLYTSPSPRD